MVDVKYFYKYTCSELGTCLKELVLPPGGPEEFTTVVEKKVSALGPVLEPG